MKKKNKIPKQFTFKSKLWKYPGPAGWHFMTLPKTVSRQIRKIYSISEEGWGRLKTEVLIGKTHWKTSIWFDTKHDAYLLPVKASVRKKEKELENGKQVAVTIKFDLDDWFDQLAIR